jgi:hypothetical protein
VIEDAEFELTLSITPDLLERFESELRAAIDRGVSTELLLTPAAAAPSPETFDYDAVSTVTKARRGITTPVIAVADGEKSVYATQDAIRDDRDRYGVIFNRSALGFLVSGFFGTVLWTTAEPLAADGDGRPFPRRYASIRRCVKDVREIGGEFFVTVEGRDVETGESRVIRGRIADVTLEETEEVASMTVETDDGEVTVGGRVAALERIEAHEIHVGYDRPPVR